MKFELMRCFYRERSKQFVLELYNMHEGISIEMAFFKSRFNFSDKIKIGNIFQVQRTNRKVHTLSEWFEMYMNAIKHLRKDGE